MKLFDPRTWFSSQASEAKFSEAGPTISSYRVGQPQWTPRNYEELSRESYMQNAIAFACISMTAQSSASCPLLLSRGKGKKRELIEDHPLLDLLNRPNPWQNLQWLIESAVTFYQIAGNVFIESVGPSRKGAPPLELWVHRPDRMKVVPGPMGTPQAYVYTVDGREKRWEVDPIRGTSNILHVRSFHPLNDWYGMGMTEPSAYAIDRHNEAGKHNMSVLQNGAVPSGALTFKPVTVAGNVVNTPKEVIQAAEERLKERYAGARNAGKPMVLGGNVDWTPFGMTMEDLQLDASKLDAARDICIAYGVPIELLLPGQSTFNNKREAKLGYYEETVIPTTEVLLSFLSPWLAAKFDDPELTLEIDLDGVEALSLRREIRQTNTTKLYDSGVITRDEAREALQYEPQPDMPQTKVDGAILTALVNSSAEIGSEPLVRYLKSVGLMDPKKTIEQLAEEARGMTPDPEDEADATTPRPAPANPDGEA